jgi:hypothetical protein
VLEIERSKAGLDESGEHVSVDGKSLQLLRVALLAGLFEQALPEVEPPADDCTALAGDDVSADLRELALLRLRKAVVELLRDRETQDAVAEELEPLVGIGAVRRPGGVRERIPEALRRERVDEFEEGFVGARRAAPATGGTRCSRQPVRRW